MLILVTYYMFRGIKSSSFIYIHTYRTGLISPTRSERCQNYSLSPRGIPSKWPLNWCLGMEGETTVFYPPLVLSGQNRFYFFAANLYNAMHTKKSQTDRRSYLSTQKKIKCKALGWFIHSSAWAPETDCEWLIAKHWSPSPRVQYN